MTDARRMIVAAYEADEPLLLLGKPGMGKTAMFESVCADQGLAFIDFRLSMRDPVDVGGMRVPDQKTGILKHYIPEDLPDAKRHGAKGIVLFDEINVVSQMMQATAYGIIQERRNGAWRMPAGWVPMASGNNVTDRAAAQRISTALANRFNVQHVEPDVDSWLDQYGSANVDPRGCSFLRFRKELFHVMPTFRRKMFAGYVGDAAADEFEAFWRIMEKAISFQEIVDNPKGARVPDDADAGLYYAVAGMIARSATRKNFDAIATYVGRLMADYQVVIMQDATSREPSLKNTGAYGAWAVHNQAVTL
jgi:hypothetical protein